MPKSNWPQHQPKRIWWTPWRVRCACGMAVYPCPAMRLGAAKAWQACQRRRYGEWAAER